MQSRNAAIIAPVGNDCHVSNDDRRRDRRPKFVAIRIEVAARPRHLSVDRVVYGQVLSTPDQNRFFSLMLNDQRCGVAVIAFDGRRVITGYLPNQFATDFVESSEPRLAFVHAGHDDVFLCQHWGSTVIPEQGVLAKLLDQVCLPTHSAVKFDSRERATLEVNEDCVPISDWRRIASRPVAMFSRVLLAEHSSPPLLAIKIVAQQRVIAFGCARQVDHPVDQDGC